MRYKVSCTFGCRNEKGLLNEARLFVRETKAGLTGFEDAEGYIMALLAGEAVCEAPGCYRADFEAYPEWEGVMAEGFKAVSGDLEEGSCLEIHTDTGYRIIRAGDMEVLETAGVFEGDGEACDMALMFSDRDGDVDRDDVIGLSRSLAGEAVELALFYDRFTVRGYALPGAAGMLGDEDQEQSELGKSILGAVRGSGKRLSFVHEASGLRILLTRRRPVYKAFKKMLEERDGIRREADKTPGQLLKAADRYLSHISLRRYIGRITSDALIAEAVPEENPLCFRPMEVWERELVCGQANRKMRERYGSFKTAFGSQLTEFASWCALFPEHARELYELGFQVSEEQDPRCEVIFGCGGCDMGDAVPLPTMVGVLNACMFRELMQDGEEDLAMSILMEEEE